MESNPSLPLRCRLHTDDPRQKYTCKECGMSFPTNQGLGGHASRHRNKQRRGEALAGSTWVGPEDSGAFVSTLRCTTREKAPHKCRKCHEVFSTGMALGGHMRVHYTGPPIMPTKKTKKKNLALLPVEHDIAAPSSPGLSFALSIKMEDTLLLMPAKATTNSSVPFWD